MYFESTERYLRRKRLNRQVIGRYVQHMSQTSGELIHGHQFVTHEEVEEEG